MPELPEVETVVRALAARLPGETVLGARFLERRVLRGDPRRTAARLRGRTVAAVRRLGKHILIDLDGGTVLCVHLGMTGRLLAGGTPGPHTRAFFTFAFGLVCFDDPRMFGRIEVMDGMPERIRKLGPDALSLSAEDFILRLRARRRRIKALLLDQAFLAGLGNIYSDEALFRAGIHPLAVSSRLSRARARALHAAVLDVLRAAIRKGGSSVSDYVDAEGRRGWFQLEHRVYQRTGELCLVCGTPIRRILVAQRATHFCPRCQRR